MRNLMHLPYPAFALRYGSHASLGQDRRCERGAKKRSGACEGPAQGFSDQTPQWMERKPERICLDWLLRAGIAGVAGELLAYYCVVLALHFLGRPIRQVSEGSIVVHSSLFLVPLSSAICFPSSRLRKYWWVRSHRLAVPDPKGPKSKHALTLQSNFQKDT